MAETKVAMWEFRLGRQAGHAEDRARGDAGADHPRDPVGEDAGLPRPRSREHAQRSLAPQYRFALRRVQSFQDRIVGLDSCPAPRPKGQPRPELVVTLVTISSTMAAGRGEEEAAKNFHSFDTICSATQERQDAVVELIGEGCDLMVVIGGFNSSNTTHLVEIAARSTTAWHIEDAANLVSARWIRHKPLGAQAPVMTEGWLPERALVIGVTAGGPHFLQRRRRTMNLATKLRAGGSPGAISKVTRIFNGSLDDIFGELLQNSRRAGATTIAISALHPEEACASTGCGDRGRTADPANPLFVT